MPGVNLRENISEQLGVKDRNPAGDVAYQTLGVSDVMVKIRDRNLFTKSVAVCKDNIVRGHREVKREDSRSAEVRGRQYENGITATVRIGHAYPPLGQEAAVSQAYLRRWFVI